MSVADLATTDGLLIEAPIKYDFGNMIEVQTKKFFCKGEDSSLVTRVFGWLKIFRYFLMMLEV